MEERRRRRCYHFNCIELSFKGLVDADEDEDVELRRAGMVCTASRSCKIFEGVVIN